MINKCNAIFEGGGVRGIGHIGAACALCDAGYTFENYAGSSAGAIVASLLASGYSANELKQIMEQLDYRKFRQEGWLDHLGTIGKVINLCTTFGVFRTDYFESWLSNLLLAKGIKTFGDLKNSQFGDDSKHRKDSCRWSLQVTASDVTDQRLLILPRDLVEFGINPDDFEVAKAVRMSMSIPLFYKPYRLIGKDGQEHLIVDGGLLSNYPVWLFDSDEKIPRHPTIGFKFVDALCNTGICKKDTESPNLLWYLHTLVSTALDAADKQHINESGGDFARTVAIPVTVKVDGKEKKIKATDFDITKEESFQLYQNGWNAGEQFRKNWNFESWKKNYRG